MTIFNSEGQGRFSLIEKIESIEKYIDKLKKDREYYDNRGGDEFDKGQVTILDEVIETLTKILED